MGRLRFSGAQAERITVSRMRIGDSILRAGAVAAALLIIAACGDGGAQTSAEPSPTSALSAAASPSPTSEPSPAPTDTPAPSPTSAPASNIPIPTRAAVPTPTAKPTFTPTPTPSRAESLAEAARDALAEAESWAFDVSVSAKGADGEVRIEMSGDYIYGALMSAAGSVETESGAFALRLSRFEDTRHVLAPDGDGWREMDAPPPFDLFADADALLRADDLRYEGREISGGAEMDAVSGKPKLYGSGAEFDALYLFDVRDGALREVRVRGEPDAGALADALGEPGAALESVEATATFSEFGKPVAISSPSMIFPSFDHAAIALSDGRAMVVGGVSGIANNDVIIPFPVPLPQFYDFSDYTWSLGLDSRQLREPGLPAGLYYSAAALNGGEVATVGIWAEDGDDEIMSLVKAFDPDSGAWRTLAGMETARGIPVLAVLSNGALMAAGGLDFGGMARGDEPKAVTSVEIYDPETDSWRTTPEMNGGAFSGAALIALADGRALALSGDDRAREAMLDMGDAERFFADTGAGYDSPDGFIAAEVYDPETDDWSATASPEIPRSDPTAILLSDGKALVAGAGVTLRNTDPSNPSRIEIAAAFAAEIYDPKADAWTRTAPMREFRANHTLTLLPDGKVLAAGGQDPRAGEFDIYATTEIYDPETGAWTAGPDMSRPRASHSATLLPNGAVFIAGGIGIHPDNGEAHPLNDGEVVALGD